MQGIIFSPAAPSNLPSFDFNFITFNPTAGSPPNPFYQYWDVLFYISGSCVGCGSDTNIFNQIITRREKQRRTNEVDENNMFPPDESMDNSFSPKADNLSETSGRNKDNAEHGRQQSLRRRMGVGRNPREEENQNPCPECPADIEDLRAPTQELVLDLFQQYALEVLDIDIATIGEVEAMPCPSNIVPVKETIEIPLSMLPQEDQQQLLYAPSIISKNYQTEKSYIENAIVESYDTLSRRDFCDPNFLQLSHASILNYVDDSEITEEKVASTTLVVEVEGTYRDHPPSFFSTPNAQKRTAESPSFGDGSTTTCYCPTNPIGHRAPSIDEFLDEFQTYFR